MSLWQSRVCFWLQHQPLQYVNIYRFWLLMGKNKATNPTPFFFTVEKTWKRSLTTTLQEYSNITGSLLHPNKRMIKYNFAIKLAFFFFPPIFWVFFKRIWFAFGNLSIKCQDIPCMFDVVCCTLEELASHILKFCSVTTAICQGIFSVKGWILFIGKSKLILFSFGIDEVRRLLCFGDSLCVCSLYLIYPCGFFNIYI